MTVRSSLSALAGAGLAGIGALQLVWATGSSWPARTRRDLAQAVTGGDEVPGVIPCVIVGSGLLVAGGVVAGAGGASRTAGLVRLGVAAGLAARGLVGGTRIAALLGLPGADPRFTTLDQRVYRPLCLGLAALVGSSLVAGDDQVQVR